MISLVTSSPSISCLNAETDLSLGLSMYRCGAHAHFSYSLALITGSGMYYIALKNTLVSENDELVLAPPVLLQYVAFKN